MTHEPIQMVTPNGIQVISKPKNIFEWNSYLGLLKEIEKVKPNPDDTDPLIISLGFFENKEIKMYKYEGEYWALRKDFKNYYNRQQFSNLCEEWIKEFQCNWLEEGIDYKIVDRAFFYELTNVKKIDKRETGRPLVLLSVEGILKLMSRSSKARILHFWLIKKFIEYKLLKAQIESFWQKLQKTESPAELYYLCAAARQLNIDKLIPQKRIGKFRGDLVIDDKFLIMIKSRRYHIDPGKQKIYDDTIRERFIQKQGYVLITFWAYEIFEDVEKCIVETIEILYKNKKLFRK